MNFKEMDKRLLGFYIFLAVCFLYSFYCEFSGPSEKDLIITQLNENVQKLKIEQKNLKKDIKAQKEKCYFEGQRDAITGDVRIAEIEKGTGKYKWVKSPWDNGEEPIYKIDEK